MDVLARPSAEPDSGDAGPAGTTADVLLVAVGPMAAVAVDAARRLTDQGFGVTVVDPRWVKPIDPVLAQAAAKHRLVVTVEDNGTVGGFGDAVARLLREHDINAPIRMFGL